MSSGTPSPVTGHSAFVQISSDPVPVNKQPKMVTFSSPTPSEQQSPPSIHYVEDYQYQEASSSAASFWCGMPCCPRMSNDLKQYQTVPKLPPKSSLRSNSSSESSAQKADTRIQSPSPDIVEEKEILVTDQNDYGAVTTSYTPLEVSVDIGENT